MRIRIYQSFASNNSGSYTIVGSFATAELAEEVARELRTMIAEHDAWVQRSDGAELRNAEDTPLARFARAAGLEAFADEGRRDDWPTVPGATSPVVTQAQCQVLVHCEMTITMPRLFGAYLFTRGGRVDVELDHAHHPLVAIFELWLPNERRVALGRSCANDVLARLSERLLDDVLREHAQPGIAPVSFVGEWGERRLGVVFEDLVAGVEAVRAAVAEAGAEMRLRLHEALTEDGDPLLALRGGGGP
jgi:hypothetical protein